jgi:uncharacterized protein with ATP-grasp and redox domains
MMTNLSRPSLPIPEPLRGSDPGSFAERTVKVRIPEIAWRTLAGNDFPQENAARLQDLIDEIPAGQIRPIQDPGAPDEQAWADYLAPYLGRNWLEVPLFLGEHYFYRRVVEATSYFQPGPWRERDPFEHEKRAGLLNSLAAIQALVGNLNRFSESGWKQGAFLRLLNADLWGNQADLSLWPAGKGDQPTHAEELQRQHLLVDHAMAIAQLVDGLRGEPARVDFLVDNAGFELVADLCLADYLLNVIPDGSVRLHLKSHPTFVSDALAKDVLDTVRHLAETGESESIELSARLERRLHSGRLQLKQDFFWTSPFESWMMPQELKRELGEAALVISKGDAQYRRLLGDRHWPYSTPLEKIVSYFPTSLVILRASKSEVMAGLKPGQAEELSQVDPEWLYNGRWGLIQLWQPPAG